MAASDSTLDLNISSSCPDIIIEDASTYDHDIGSELVTNGAFASSSNWTTAGLGWSISSGVATHSGVPSGTITQTIAIVPSGTYQVEFDVTGFSALVNSTYASLGINGSTGYGSDHSIPITANGSYSEEITVPADATLMYISFTSVDALSIDNVSVKEIVAINRNISILKPDGTFADAGGSSQEYTLQLTKASFIDASQTGETLTLTACGTDLEFEIPNVYSESSFDCMMNDLVSAINDSEDGEFDNIEAEYDSGSETITISYIEPGIPITISASYTNGSSFFTLTESAAASSSIGNSMSGDNELSYTTAEDGGQYTIKLTVWTSECDKYSVTAYLWNWCYTYKQLEECFIRLVKEEECGCGCKKCKYSKATELKNKMEAAQLEEILTGSGPAVQKLIDSANAICNGTECECND